MSRRIQKTALFTGAIVGAYSLLVAGVYWRQRDLLYQAPKKTQSLDAHRVVVPQCELGPALHGWIDNPGQRDALIYQPRAGKPLPSGGG